MGKKTLIPEEKWEGLRHAMEEAGRVGAAIRPADEAGRKAADGGKKGKGKKKEKKEKKRGKGKGKKNGEKEGKKGKKKGKKK